ncbi:CLUMA_CG020033, isoform A [Clunio marinus]|uniref:CLUMA_CG020033, isoform A n=1 Tax=Clunio marinus TaxID=568069 RepID=A0A1J1J4X3_9DIPT|nr:CLUMA_CG020033, isoform A [Clunio marinus]
METRENRLVGCRNCCRGCAGVVTMTLIRSRIKNKTSSVVPMMTSSAEIPTTKSHDIFPLVYNLQTKSMKYKSFVLLNTQTS